MRGVGQHGRTRWRVGAAVAVLLAGALGGCASSERPSTAGTTTAAATTTAASRAVYTPAPCPNPVYPGVPQLDLGAGVDCGYLTVPENRSTPDGRTIRLAVARAHATSPNPKPDPLLYLAGGPGGSGFLSAAPRIAAGWNSDRDVIFLDQRGTWKSDPLLSCPEIDSFLSDWVGLVSTDPATAARSAAATGACRDRLAATGVDLGSYDTAENAADVADLRTALGIDSWNLYGVSYGTDLALQTLRLRPQGIRSVVLDSVVPPQSNIIETFWPSAASGIDAVVAACAAQPACASAHPALRDDLFRLATSLTDHPLSVAATDPATGKPVTVVVDGYKLVNLVVTASLVPGSIAGIPAMIGGLTRGDGSLAAAALLAGRPPSGVTAYGLALGVFCSESVDLSSREAIVAKAKQALPQLPDSVLGLAPQAPYIVGDCARWNVPSAPPPTATSSDVPVLILDGNLDAITAPANGALVAGELSKAVRVAVPDAAHDTLLWSTACTLPIMKAFLDQPGAAPDTTCTTSLAPAPFTTS